MTSSIWAAPAAPAPTLAAIHKPAVLLDVYRNRKNPEQPPPPKFAAPDGPGNNLVCTPSAPLGVLPDGSPECVLEDLVSADRYRLLGMKRVCQSMLRISANSCMQVCM